MIKGSYDELIAITAAHRCPEHDDALEVVWSPIATEKTWVIKCPNGHYPDQVLDDIGRAVIPEVVGPSSDAARVTAFTAGGAGSDVARITGGAFGFTAKADLGTGEVLTVDMLRQLVDYGRRYGLDVARGHVVLMYGKPYVTEDGYLWTASKSKIPMKMHSRPLTADERAAFDVPEGDHAWIATIERLDDGSEFTAYGYITLEEMTASSKRRPNELRSPVIAAKPREMCQKRAEWQVLKRAFPIGVDDG